MAQPDHRKPSETSLLVCFGIRRIQFAKPVDSLNVDKDHVLRMGDDEGGGGAWGSGGGDDDDKGDADGNGAETERLTSGGWFFQGIVHRMISFVIGVAILGSCCCCIIAVAFFFPGDPYVGEYSASAADGKTIKLTITKNNGVYTDETGVPAAFKIEHDKDRKTITLTMNDNAKDFWNGKSAVEMTYVDRTLVGNGKSFTKVETPIGANRKGGAEKPAVDAKDAGDKATK